MWVNRLIRAGGVMVDFVFPRLCPDCGDRVLPQGDLVCGSCLATMEPLALPICPICGCANARLSGSAGCHNCPEGTIYFDAARGTTAFAGTAKTLVEKVKYTGRTEYARHMAPPMVTIIEKEFRDRRFDALIPVPLHGVRQRERGFNQSAVIARLLSRWIDVSVNERLVRRVRATPSQTRLNRKEREQNIAGAFEVADGPLARGKRLLLVDDVYTTGATLNECARVLKEAGANSIHCVAFARAVI